MQGGGEGILFQWIEVCFFPSLFIRYFVKACWGLKRSLSFFVVMVLMELLMHVVKMIGGKTIHLVE